MYLVVAYTTQIICVKSENIKSISSGPVNFGFMFFSLYT